MTAIGGPTGPGEPHWIELDEVDSTNAEVMRRALAGERGPLYVRADRQTAGRGRSGRNWQTPAGNLALSRLVRLECQPSAAPQLAFVAGLAVHRAAATVLAGIDVATRLHLKWPNDLLLDRAKLAGILIEASTIGADRLAVIGIGVNLAEAPSLPDRSTIALRQVAGESTTPRAFAAIVGERLEQALELWDHGRGFPAIRAAWLQASLPIGTPISVNTGRGAASGTFAGLEPGGALLLDVGNGGRQTYSFGDVALIAG